MMTWGVILAAMSKSKSTNKKKDIKKYIKYMKYIKKGIQEKCQKLEKLGENKLKCWVTNNVVDANTALYILNVNSTYWSTNACSPFFFGCR